MIYDFGFLVSKEIIIPGFRWIYRGKIISSLGFYNDRF